MGGQVWRPSTVLRLSKQLRPPMTRFCRHGTASGLAATRIGSAGFRQALAVSTVRRSMAEVFDMAPDVPGDGHGQQETDHHVEAVKVCA
jgi:hypothetical protein